MNALVIDDNYTVRRFLRHKLEQMGWSVRTAKDAYDGLLAFREFLPELITIDLLMPINDSVDALHLIDLIREEHPSAIVLAVSSFAPKLDVPSFCAKKSIELFDKADPGKAPFTRLLERVAALSEQIKSTVCN